MYLEYILFLHCLGNLVHRTAKIRNACSRVIHKMQVPIRNNFNTLYLNKKTGETSASVNVRDELELPLLENEKAETYCFAVFEEDAQARFSVGPPSDFMGRPRRVMRF